MTSKPRILVVTHQFTPHVSPRTTRWSILCEELSSRGYEVHVITGTRQNGNENKNYQVQYLGSDRLGSLIESTRRASSKSEENNIIKKLFFFVAKRIYRLIYRVFAWPDYSMLWYFSVRMKIKNIPDYDLLISVSLPFTSHLVAYTLNKKRGTRWIMDIGDPFYLKKDAPENNKYLYSYLNKYFENKFYKHASKVVFTHKESMEHHKKTFDTLNQKSSLLPPVFHTKINKKTNNFNYKKTPVKVAYFGVLTIGVRTPDNFLSFINALDMNNIEIHWYTNEDSKHMIKSVYSKSSKNFFHDMVPRDEALDLMDNEYHALLNIGNQNPFQLPSKVIEYISTGKPIIHYSEITDDPVVGILNERSNSIIINRNTNPEQAKKEFKEKMFSDKSISSVENFNSVSVVNELLKLI
tara:strand:+ start:1651 stop:2877 length:1227 start_codon:yes stop_codon:yes gene_type:complete